MSRRSGLPADFSVIVKCIHPHHGHEAVVESHSVWFVQPYVAIESSRPVAVELITRHYGTLQLLNCKLTGFVYDELDEIKSTC